MKKLLKGLVRGTPTTAIVRGTATLASEAASPSCTGTERSTARAVFEVGENGIEANQPYQVNEKGEPIKAQKAGQP